MASKIANVQEKIGIIGYGDGFLQMLNGDTVYFYRMEPSNLSVLSEIDVRAKIEQLASLISVAGNIEFFAMDDRENFNDNRNYLRKRINDPNVNPAIKGLLLKEERFVKAIEADSSSARKFMIAYRGLKGHEKETRRILVNLENEARHQSMTISQLSKQEIMEMIAVYFHQDASTPDGHFEDIDGEDYYSDVDFELLKEQVRQGAFTESILNIDFNPSSNKKEGEQ